MFFIDYGNVGICATVECCLKQVTLKNHLTDHGRLLRINSHFDRTKYLDIQYLTI